MFEPSSVSDDATYRDAVALSHIIKYSRARVSTLSELAVAGGNKIIIETQEHDGLRFLMRGEWTHLPAVRTAVVEDTAGAGDWVSVGFAHSLFQARSIDPRTLERRNVSLALRLGQALAALNCQFKGARGMMRSLSVAEVRKRIVRLDLAKGLDAQGPHATEQKFQSRDAELCQMCSPRATARAREGVRAAARYSA
jgi:fructokinase